MPASVVVGTQWGDEGKGKATDYLADRMDLVVRYQGGNNAGHTILAEGHTLKLQLIPSGILYPHITSVIADGVVVDPRVLLAELDGLEAVGVDPSKLVVSGNCHMIMPYHLELERVTERFLGTNALGTTKRGIGPAYGDKAARIGLRIQDLFDEKIFREKLDVVLREKNQILTRIYGRLPLVAGTIVDDYMRYAERLRPRVTDTSKLLHDARRAGTEVLLGGAARGRAGHDARPRQGDLSVRHVVEPRHRVRARVRRHRPARGGAGDRDHEGVRDEGRGGPVPDGGSRSRGRPPGRTRSGVRHRDRAQAPLRVVRRGDPAIRRPCERADRAVRHQARRPVRVRDGPGLYRVPRGGGDGRGSPAAPVAVPQGGAGVRGAGGVGGRDRRGDVVRGPARRGSQVPRADPGTRRRAGRCRFGRTGTRAEPDRGRRMTAPARGGGLSAATARTRSRWC